MAQLFVIDELSTASEEFDGETIVIQFKHGTYSVLTGCGNAIFDMFRTPLSAEAAVEAVRAATGSEPDPLGEEVNRFVAELVGAHILVEAAPGSQAGKAVFKGPYSTPGMETYDDLADMMLVDPVHEVDMSEGWPKRPET